MSSIGAPGFFCQCTRFSSRRGGWVPDCMYKSADTTSERQSSQWFVIPFCPQRGKNDFQCYIFEVLGLENLKGALWKGEGYTKGNCCCCCFISEVSETGEVLKYLLLFYKDEVQLKYQLSISTNTLLRKIRVVFLFQHPHIVHMNTSPAKCLFKGVMCLTAWKTLNCAHWPLKTMEMWGWASSESSSLWAGL